MSSINNAVFSFDIERGDSLSVEPPLTPIIDIPESSTLSIQQDASPILEDVVQRILSLVEESEYFLLQPVISKTDIVTFFETIHQLIAEYPSPIFEELVQKTVRIFQLLEADPAQVFRLLEASRKCHHLSHIIPAFAIKGSGILPECELKQKDELDGLIVYQEAYVEPSTQPLFAEGACLTKDQLDIFVRVLAAKTDIFPWSYKKDGCYARAHIMLSFFILSGIPEKYLSQIVMVHSQTHCKCNWRYHVAPLVSLEDGTKWVIDPSLDPNQALPVNVWIDAQPNHQKRFSYYQMSKVDVNSFLKNKMADYCFTLIMDHKARFGISKDRQLLKVKTHNPKSILHSMEDLGEFRYLVDHAFTQKQFTTIKQASHMSLEHDRKRLASEVDHDSLGKRRK